MLGGIQLSHPASVGKPSYDGCRVTASHTSRAMRVNLYADRLMTEPSHSKVSPEGEKAEAGFELEPLVPFVSHWTICHSQNWKDTQEPQK